MDLLKNLGMSKDQNHETHDDIIRYLNLKLASMGVPYYKKEPFRSLGIAEDLVRNFSEKNRLLADTLCPADLRIQTFINSFLKEIKSTKKPKIPAATLTLDRHGLARVLSLPPDRDEFITDILKSYRIEQGILHNPRNDRRTTEGVFHIAEGGLPVPPDKKSIPKVVFANLLYHAFNPPGEIMRLPFTSSQEEKSELFVSLLLRPLVCPHVPGYISQKTMEIRLFAPGNLVSNLDFVESIFGNAGNPHLPDNDSGLDIEGWTGHTGCVVLAPHLTQLTKKELGLPEKRVANPRQLREGVYWENASELYNNGSPFKISCRSDEGVIITIIADNYFGYCKKEVKTQISYSANLYGLVEEEHAGGALAFARYNEGERFIPDSFKYHRGHSFAEVKMLLKDNISVLNDGYAIDKRYRDIIYLPENTSVSIQSQSASWEKDGKRKKLRILPGKTYIHPAGYQLKLKKHPIAPSWSLVTTSATGTLCHKPCTVSGGGKSEISKSVMDSTSWGPEFIADFDSEMDRVTELINFDYGNRLIDPPLPPKPSRDLLSSKRSLGSVIKLLTPSLAFTEEYNRWLKTIPNQIKSLAYLIKRFYKEEWGDNWREHFSVDVINGEPGHELKYNNRRIVSGYSRVALRKDGAWCTFKLRQDFSPSEKLQWEDDISASIVVPTTALSHLDPQYKNPSIKIVSNCEYRFFQRPDDARIRGYDKQAEIDLSQNDCFVSNFEPLTTKDAKEIYELAISFDEYTKPMKKIIRKIAKQHGKKYFITSDHPRLIASSVSKNPRYLQIRPGLIDEKKSYLTNTCIRLSRKIPADKPLYIPVNAVLPGRRNNRAESGNRPLAVYNPIHFQELPELFMDFMGSLTGKSPSTTGAGSEGALTKGPFNSLIATTDLNNALLSYILTGYQGFTTASGFIGPKYQVNHDISLLIPEIWCRLKEDEREPGFLIKNRYLEKIEDFEYNGKKILASRLGYRITHEFTVNFLGRIFDNPGIVFDSEMLRPETQDRAEFVEGVKNIVEAQTRIAKDYIEDGSVQAAIPPLKALIYIMGTGEYEGKTISDPDFRQLFDRDSVLKSDWYQERLVLKQKEEIKLQERFCAYLKSYLDKTTHQAEAERLGLKERLKDAKKRLKECQSKNYLESLVGTIGRDPLFKG